MLPYRLNANEERALKVLKAGGSLRITREHGELNMRLFDAHDVMQPGFYHSTIITLERLGAIQPYKAGGTPCLGIYVLAQH
jgi:hypothetical protein